MDAIDEILDFMKKNPTYYLATVDAAGNPQVRAFGTITKIDGNLFIQTGKKKDVYRQAMAHPRIALCDFNPQTGAWLRLDADVTEDDSVATLTTILDEYPELKKVYAPGDGNTTSFKLHPVHATISSFSAAPRTLI